ncbi:MAG: PAS domain S-box protein [Bacteroidetes bacterium]|nr:PAS domain S-box protein [Bacteroidota bacterium]
MADQAHTRDGAGDGGRPTTVNLNLKVLLSIFRSSPNCIALTDFQYALRIVNVRALVLFGFDREDEVEGTNLLALVAPEQRARLSGILSQLHSEGTMHTEDFTFLRKDGSTFLGELNGSLIRDGDNRPILVLFSIIDVTEKRTYENAIKAILSGTLSATGEKFFRAFVLELSALLRVRFAFVLQPIAGSPAQARTLAIAEDGKIVENAAFPVAGTLCENPDGDPVVFLGEGAARRYPGDPLIRRWKAEGVIAVRLHSTPGVFRGMIGVAHDRALEDNAPVRSVISLFATRATAEIERLETDEFLRENESRLRSIIDNAPLGAHLYELLPDGRLIFAGSNRSADRILGIDHHTLVGKTIEEAWPHLVGTPIPQAYKDVAREGGMYAERGIGYSQGSFEGSFEISSFQTGPNRMAVFFRDVTEQQRAEKALIKAKEHAERANRAKSSLLGNLSHEFRTPITGILGLAELLRDEIRDPSLLEQIDGITTSARRLYATLDAILKLAQLSSGDVTPTLRPVLPGKIVDEITARFRPAAESKGLAFTATPCDGLPPFQCDEQILLDILGYLTDNAIKYTQQGTVAIRCFQKTDTDHAAVLFEVKDTGIGIRPEDMEFIFTEFRQLSEGTGRIYEGAGIGLPVAKRMIEVLEGTISVESAVGAGSTFTVSLPLHVMPVAPPLKQRPARQEDTGLRPGSGLPQVLIVEDNFINKTVIADFLKNVCKTDHARNGTVAVQMAKKKHYDAILMDINLGSGPDGVQTAKLIRQLSGYVSTPIVAVTGYTMPGERERLLAEGLTHYIPKPFDSNEIRDIVARVLS